MSGRGSARTSRTKKNRPASARRGPRGRSARARLQAGLASKRVKSAAQALGLTTTRRAAIAALVVCALAFTLAVPLRTYLTQRADIAEQAERKAELQREVSQLERTKAQLADPVQVEAEARSRLRYVMPGETPYVVELPDQAAVGSKEAVDAEKSKGEPWYESLWDSVESGGKEK